MQHRWRSQEPLYREGLLSALSSRTGTEREGQQRVGYDPFANPPTNGWYLRIAAVRSSIFARSVLQRLKRYSLAIPLVRRIASGG
jgi:hypothetical protein